MKGPPTLADRAAGLLLHPTSLPGPHGVGDLGAPAHGFVDFLAAAGQRWWQMLPIHPPGEGNSPYTAVSAFAGNPLLIAPEPLAEAGLLRRGEIVPLPGRRGGRVRFAAAARHREPLLRLAFSRAAGAPSALRRAQRRFEAEQADWLGDYCLFMALKGRLGNRPWVRWPAELRDRRPAALERAARELAGEVAFRRFMQFWFDRQWMALRKACEARGIGLIGDLPLFVSLDSAEVWARRELFQLGPTGRPTQVAGVPPDDFSAVGQLWGNPLYRWGVSRRDGHRWWSARISHLLRLFHAVRLDHFIGLHHYWAVPAGARDARGGRYRPGPRAGFFHALRARLGELPLIAEDLGLVTPEVEALRDRFALPGMRVLQFGLGHAADTANPHLPHNHVPRAVVYTGTHDNDTTQGWFRTLNGGAAARARVLRYADCAARDIHWGLIRLALMSVSRTAVVPVQDLLGLGSAARMNRPGVPGGNWGWRLAENDLTLNLAERLAGLTEAYGRTASRQSAQKGRA